MGLVGRLRRRWAVVTLAATVLLTGGMATAAAVHTARQSSDRYAGQVVDRYADDMSAAITDQVTHYGEILSDLAHSLGAQPQLTAAQFAHITTGLNAKRLPGAAGVAFVVPASSAQTADVQRWWRARGAPTLQLDPKPRADEHEFVIFDKVLSPTAVNLQGTDLRNSPQAEAALRTARQSGTLAISPAYQLLRDKQIPAAQRQTSVVLAAPVSGGLGDADADVFHGWLLMGLHGQDFLAQTLLDRTQGAVQVALADPAGGGTVIAANTAGTRVDDSTLVRQKTVVVGHRRWHVTLWPTTRLIAAADRGVARLIAGAGGALTILLTALITMLASSRNRALEQVDRATAALRRDITRRELVEAQLRDRERELQHLAFHDPLTGLANRTLFHNRVGHAIAAHDGGMGTLAALFIDLDDFKPINDNLGHEAGDTVLQTIADRLVTGIRAGDTAARLGGDEFAVLVEDLTTVADAHATAEHIIDSIEQPIPVQGTEVQVSASVGIAVHRPGGDAHDLLREADSAMYTAKTGGKGRYILADA